MTAGLSAALVIIGDEILSAKVLDSNGAHATQRLRAWGIALRRIITIPDDENEIIAAVNDARQRFDHVFTSGGIGPTHDDVTIAAIAKAFAVGVVRMPEIEEKLRASHPGPISDALLRLADVPQGARLIPSALDWLSVICIENVFILPGIPELFVRLFDSLQTQVRGEPFFGRAIYLTCDEPEIAELLAKAQLDTPNVAIGSYPKLHANYLTKITCESRDLAAVEKTTAALLAVLPPAFVLRVEEF